MGTGDAPTGASNRLDVRSPDGTSLAVWADGEGPPIVLVHGALQDHTLSEPFVEELRGTMRTFAMDRRGRGGSGDAPEHSIEREFDDIAAVVDAVADRTRAPVALWGHSYGADCAMGAATRTAHIGRLVLYEPGLGAVVPAGALEAIEEHVAAGDLAAAAMVLLREVVEMTEDEIDGMRSNPAWPARLATASTVARELRAESEWVYRPGQFAVLAAPTLLLAGSESPPEQDAATRRAAAAIPDARIRVLEGHGHAAHRTDPAMVAAIVREFVAA